MAIETQVMCLSHIHQVSSWVNILNGKELAPWMIVPLLVIEGDQCRISFGMICLECVDASEDLTRGDM
jgi:hypothetical protein